MAVDLAGLDQEMRSGFLAFLEQAGLVLVDWATEDVVILTATAEEVTARPASVSPGFHLRRAAT